jgi:membrane-bound serine protease (ClpP class)
MTFIRKTLACALCLAAAAWAQQEPDIAPQTEKNTPSQPAGTEKITDRGTGTIIEKGTEAGSPAADPEPATDGAPSDFVLPLGISRGSLKPGQRGLNLPPKPKTMRIPINDAESTKYGMIDDWQAGFVERRLRRAKAEKFDLVVLEIDTNGGSVGACERINRGIQECGVPVIAFVKGKAFSGGAIIALGCKAIVMAPGSQIGGAEVVDGQGGDIGGSMKKKIESMMLAMVGNLCDLNGHPKPIAQGMVNLDLEVYEIRDPKIRFVTGDELAQMEKSRGAKVPIVRQWKKKDKILTLTAKDAVNSGLALGLASDPEETFTGLNVAPAQIDLAVVTPAEKVSRALGHPIWSILLVLVGIVALFLELKSPGHGMGYITFAFCMGVFFWLQIFSSNAGLWEVALFGVGAAALAVEIFILPGFGIAGFLGIVLILTSIIFAFLPEHISISNLFKKDGLSPWEAVMLTAALKWAFIALISIVAVTVVGLVRGARLPGLGRMALRTEIHGGARSRENVVGADGSLAGAPGIVLLPALGAESAQKLALVGKQGLTETVLRPSGKVRLDGITYDAVSEGAFLEAGVKVSVLRVSANGLVVRALA